MSPPEGALFAIGGHPGPPPCYCKALAYRQDEARVATHELLNQPPPLSDYNLFASDRALTEAVRREGAGWAAQELDALGARLGSAETIEWGFQANANPPVLHAFDRYGNRQDRVEFHPAWHRLMALGIGAGLHAAPWA